MDDKKKTKKPRLGIYIDFENHPELYKVLTAEADADQRPPANYCRKLLYDLMKQKKKIR